jgi:hypothetical protein
LGIGVIGLLGIFTLILRKNSPPGEPKATELDWK